MINFNLNSANQLLINTKIPQQEKNTLVELKNEFEKEFGGSGYFLIASSGSSKKSEDSVKLIALHIKKVLNSAQRFNQYYRAGKNNHWGLVLPEFHVAGLAIRARAFLAGAVVFAKDWSADRFGSWIQENQISYISMVPAQVFDLVQKKIIYHPGCKLEKIFVGGGDLHKELYAQAVQLNWPIVETYGMTETASMIAIKEEKKATDFYQLLPGVEADIVSDLLSIRCNSLLTATVQKISDKIMIKTVPENSWYQSEDRAEIIAIEGANKGAKALKLLGRVTDYIKILGEGVSLAELRNQLAKLLLAKNLEIAKFELLALTDPRAGHKLVLVMEGPDTLKTTTALVDELISLYNRECRPYEKISHCVRIGQIPRTTLGKLKIEELKYRVIKELNKGSYGEN